jgi:hypothetical protein
VDPRGAYDQLTALQRHVDRLVRLGEIADELLRVDPIMEVDGAVAPPATHDRPRSRRRACDLWPSRSGSTHARLA